MIGLLKRWATRSLQRQVDKLETELHKRDATIAVLEAERDAMAGVIARDRMRVASECAMHARTKAEAEGVAHERDYEGTGRR